MNLHQISNLSFCSFSLHLSILSTEKVTAALHTHTDSSQKSICLTKFSYTWRGKRVKTQEATKNISVGVSELCHLNTRPPKKRDFTEQLLPLPHLLPPPAANMQNYSDINTKPELGHMHWHFPFIGFCQRSKCRPCWLQNAFFFFFQCFFLDKLVKVDGQGHSIAGLTVSQRNYLSSHKQPRRADYSSRFDTIFGPHNPPIFIQFYLNLQRVFNIDYTTLTEILFAQPARTV